MRRKSHGYRSSRIEPLPRRIPARNGFARMMEEACRRSTQLQWTCFGSNYSSVLAAHHSCSLAVLYLLCPAADDPGSGPVRLQTTGRIEQIRPGKHSKPCAIWSGGKARHPGIGRSRNCSTNLRALDAAIVFQQAESVPFPCGWRGVAFVNARKQKDQPGYSRRLGSVAIDGILGRKVELRLEQISPVENSLIRFSDRVFPVIMVPKSGR